VRMGCLRTVDGTRFGQRAGPRIVVAGWVVPFAIGTLLGAAFDADHVGTTLVFGDRKRVSFAPVVGHRTYGAAVQLTIR